MLKSFFNVFKVAVQALQEALQYTLKMQKINNHTSRFISFLVRNRPSEGPVVRKWVINAFVSELQVQQEEDSHMLDPFMDCRSQFFLGYGRDYMVKKSMEACVKS